MARTSASRKFQITFNNPLLHGYTHEVIIKNLEELTGCQYWCLCDEIGEENATPHTHVYCAYKNPKEFHAMRRRFYGAHIEIARGSHSENRDYIRKQGKWANDAKHETNLPETFRESGELPEEPSAHMKQSEAILAMIEDGATNADILRAFPSAMNHLPRIEEARQALNEEQCRKEFRKLDVYYIWGPPGVGKTRGVMEKYGYENVFRVTDYEHPFDGYSGEKVLLLDEFRSSLPFALMLNVIDGYPLKLPCRYAKRVARYTKVFIVTNIPLNSQYPNVQREEPVSYQAFLRRIHHTYELLPSSGSEDPF